MTPPPRPRSAPAPPQGTLGDFGHIGTSGKRPAHWAPRHSLGCSSSPPPKPPISPPSTIAGTALFDKYHPWVNTAGILGACCVGRLAKPTPVLLCPRRRRWSATCAAAAGVATPADGAAAPDRMDVELSHPRVSWDEAGIQSHDAERGVSFGKHHLLAHPHNILCVACDDATRRTLDAYLPPACP